MKLMTIEEYLNTFYTPGSRPTRRTMIRLIKEGIIHGKKQGKTYYVDIDREAIATGNPLVDRVLL